MSLVPKECEIMARIKIIFDALYTIPKNVKGVTRPNISFALLSNLTNIHAKSRDLCRQSAPILVSPTEHAWWCCWMLFIVDAKQWRGCSWRFIANFGIIHRYISRFSVWSSNLLVSMTHFFWFSFLFWMHLAIKGKPMIGMMQIERAKRNKKFPGLTVVTMYPSKFFLH